jgi:hypothetical protein
MTAPIASSAAPAAVSPPSGRSGAADSRIAATGGPWRRAGRGRARRPR